jgi:uncharacterized damage-inducible protein DinB
MLGHTTDAIHDTPLHMTEFDGSYIREFDGEMLMRAPNDSRQHSIINYSKSWKLVKEARQINPYAVRKDWTSTIGFGMSFIPTSMPLLFLVWGRPR